MRSSTAVAGAAAISVLAWVVSGVLVAGRGLDMTDESFYLVTYRWWDSYEPTFTGTQYLFGPLFEGLGYRIDHLRLARLALHVLVNAILAMALLTWSTDRTGLEMGRAPRLATVLTIVVGGASAYLWLPLSIGYNDVTILSALMCSAAVCHAATPSRWMYLTLPLAGIGLASAVLAKWAAVGMGGLFVLTLGYLLHRRGLRTLALAGASLATGVAALMAYVHTIVPLDELASTLTDANARLASSTNAPSDLLVDYVTGTVALAVPAAAAALLLSLVWLALVRRLATRPGPATVLCLSAVPLLAFALTGRPPLGGHDQDSVTVCLWTFFAFGLFVALLTHRAEVEAPSSWRSTDVVVICWLVAAPWLHGLGTGNTVYLLAISTVAPWMCVLVFAWLRMIARPHGDPAPLTGVIVAAVVLLGSAAAVTNLVTPYRADPYAQADTVAPGDELVGVLLSEEDAASYAALRRATSEQDIEHVLVLDELPGLSLVLGVPPYAEAWTSATDPGRTRAAVTAVCSDQGPPSLVVLTRELSAEDTNALRNCGIDFYADYRPVPYRDPNLEIAVYAASTS